MAKTTQKLKEGDVYDGPMAVYDGEEVGFVKAFYALTEDGKALREPIVRLVHVDLAPGDEDDGSQEFRVAGKSDPPQTTSGPIVEFEPESVTGAGEVQ